MQAAHQKLPLCLAALPCWPPASLASSLLPPSPHPCRQRVLFSEPLLRQQAEGSGASEDVQSNIMLPSDGAAGSAAAAARAARAAAAAAAAAAADATTADDRVSCAPMPSDAAHGSWAGPQAAAAPPGWQQPLTADHACGSGGAGGSGSGAGTGHATQTGVSLGVVPSMSGVAGAGSVPQTARAPAVGQPLQPERQAEQSAGEEVDGARAVAAAAAASLPQATHEGQGAGGQWSSSPGSGGRTETVQQPQLEQEPHAARSVPNAAPCAEPLQQGVAAPCGHKRPRARSPSPLPNDS